MDAFNPLGAGATWKQWAGFAVAVIAVIVVARHLPIPRAVKP